MSKPPAFPVYTKDFDTDERVLLMSLAEEGAYWRLFRHQWRKGSIPQGHGALAEILRVPRDRVAKLWPALAPCFDGTLEPPEFLVATLLHEARRGRRRRIPLDVRLEVLQRDGHRCRYCGETEGLHIDHVHPFSRGGDDSPGNLQALCGPCNLRKAARL